MQLPAFFHKKITLLVLGIIVLLFYVGFNVWLFRASQGTNKASSQTTSGFSNDLVGKPGNLGYEVEPGFGA